MNMLRDVVAVAAALVCCATGSALAEEVASQTTSSTSSADRLEAVSTLASGTPDEPGAVATEKAAPAPKPRVNYVLGAIVSSSPDYAYFKDFRGNIRICKNGTANFCCNPMILPLI